MISADSRDLPHSPHRKNRGGYMKPGNYCKRTQYVGVTLGDIPYCSGKNPDCTDGDGNIDDPAKGVNDSE